MSFSINVDVGIMVLYGDAALVGCTVRQDLEAMKAPRKVLDAGRIIDEHTEAGLSAPQEFVTYVKDWVTRQRGNNRYGR